MQVRIIENSRLAKLAAYMLHSETMAVTIHHKIYLHNCTKYAFLKNKKWVCHELIHVQQYDKLGALSFLVLYFFEWIRNGYKKNKFETEANLKENDEEILKNVYFI